MKKIILISLCMLLVATSAFALIAGSRHDLSGGLYANGVKSSCAYCHTPHHAVGVTAPLWNRATPAGPYTVYGNGSGTLAGSAVAQPGANSTTCLSCHDGTINVGDVVNGTDDTPTRAGVLTAGKITSAAGLIGTDLRTTHPVGVVYDSTVTLAGLSNVVNGSNQVNGKLWKIYGGGDGTGTVECGSCHDPHNTTNGPASDVTRYFMKDSYSSICADCHSAK